MVCTEAQFVIISSSLLQCRWRKSIIRSSPIGFSLNKSDGQVSYNIFLELSDVGLISALEYVWQDFVLEMEATISRYHSAAILRIVCLCSSFWWCSCWNIWTEISGQLAASSIIIFGEYPYDEVHRRRNYWNAFDGNIWNSFAIEM